MRKFFVAMIAFFIGFPSGYAFANLLVEQPANHQKVVVCGWTDSLHIPLDYRNAPLSLLPTSPEYPVGYWAELQGCTPVSASAAYGYEKRNANEATRMCYVVECK